MSVDSIVADVRARFPVLGPLTVTYNAPVGEARFRADTLTIDLPPGYDPAITGPHFLYHELGHAHAYACAVALNADGHGEDHVYTPFWTRRAFTDFPTWTAAQDESQRRRLVPNADLESFYAIDPKERYAECFNAVLQGWEAEGKDPNASPAVAYAFTTYQTPLDRAAMLAFFQTAHKGAAALTTADTLTQLGADIAAFDAKLAAIGPNGPLPVGLFNDYRALFQRELDLLYVRK